MKDILDDFLKVLKIGVAIVIGIIALGVWLAYGLSKLVGITGIHL